MTSTSNTKEFDRNVFVVSLSQPEPAREILLHLLRAEYANSKVIKQIKEAFLLDVGRKI